MGDEIRFTREERDAIRILPPRKEMLHVSTGRLFCVQRDDGAYVSCKVPVDSEGVELGITWTRDKEGALTWVNRKSPEIIVGVLGDVGISAEVMEARHG